MDRKAIVDIREPMMLGYWTAQERYDQRLLDFAVDGFVGFNMIVSRDHFHPWCDKGGQSGFPWAEKTKNVEVGTAVITLLLRCHPVEALS